MPSVPAPLLQRASEQHGHLTTADALELGLSASALSRRVASGQVLRVQPRVYRLAGVPRTDEGHLAAELLALGDAVVASHSWAA